ncbi:hypothetical protein A2801_03895 [Candidatus Woesebacteria bacterium RIFCSPHIGHO2_01_FULL_41_10]|uniref:TGS domain-containing protein n=1 Tax=Candidatus Woesebacteria bacterium RIFCSPHIGHO2_01_FULL_41_10 TaxID=1802500 RepID=A0A1F7YUE8_9BACT|nr:MAG: hypothetical protein A2801_03895 [Candidatus Woesebacteria bacterium RIFCSPHIGHO2_01_FULL_41_10]
MKNKKRLDQLKFVINDTCRNVDLAKVEHAYLYAVNAHAGQKRLNGDDWIIHPLSVASTLAQWGLDETTLIAGLLHDVVEESSTTQDDLVREFGSEVATLVKGVSKVTAVRLQGSSEAIFVESLRKMIIAMAHDLRVVFIKLADRIHNMETLSALPKEKQIQNARETLEIYAPLAERLGIGRAKSLLEDLAFPYVYAKEYKKVTRESTPYYLHCNENIVLMQETLERDLRREGVEASVSGRAKGYYSLWRKLQRAEIDWDYEKIHDYAAIRIMVESAKDCYVALGIIHELFKPIPKIGVSDFIAQPKPNGYQSIHTKVFGPKGGPVEIQIRTYKMHQQAEYGAAAHWQYAEVKIKAKSGKKLETVKQQNQGYKWIRQLVSWQQELSDSDEFVKAVKFDGFQYRNFVFSPKGDVYDLPQNATPVDYAFAVHTDLGHYISGAKVNGKIVPLKYKLQSGDVCEIIKNKNRNLPRLDWLEFVVTTAAKREIGRELRKRR